MIYGVDGAWPEQNAALRHDLYVLARDIDEFLSTWLHFRAESTA